ncbi:phosphatidylinositol mannoside acyltransferase [Actinoalloteichus sp. AHMU CJ021]|nr:phosphatidylinositol mannoside acyltransferase [Actinoalloteichus sp. AHMU CJ021]
MADRGYGAGWALVRTVPPPLADRLFTLGADLAFERRGRGVRQLARNLRRVVPDAGPAELARLVRTAMRSYARYWREAFQLPAVDHAAVRRTFDRGIENPSALDEAMSAGRGVVVALPHSGNWDMAGLWAAHRYGGLTTVVERLRPESVYERFVAYRESLGFEILPADGGRRTMMTMLERLRAGGLVCLVADRDLSSGGVPVDFFGERTRMPAGPAWLAARTGATLLPATTWFTPSGWGLRFARPVAAAGGAAGVAGATQAVADAFAEEIGRHPEDWHMLQPLWLSDLRARGRRAEPGDARVAPRTGRETVKEPRP